MGRRHAPNVELQRFGFQEVLVLACLVCGCQPQLASAQMRPISTTNSVQQQAGAEVPVASGAAAEAGDAGQANGGVDSLASRIEALQARIDQLEGSADGTEESRESLVAAYRESVLQLQAAQQAQTNASQWQKRLEDSAQLLADAKREKESLDDDSREVLEYDPSALSFEALQTAVQTQNAQLSTASSQQESLVAEQVRRAERRKELPNAISSARTQLDALGSAPDLAGSDGPALQEAQQWLWESQRRALQEQINAFEAEQRMYEAETALLPLQAEIATGQERVLSQGLSLLTTELNARRQYRIADYAMKLRDLDAPESPTFEKLEEWLGLVVQTEEEEGQGTAFRWSGLAAKRISLTAEVERAQAILNRWKDRRAKISTRINSGPESGPVSGFNSWVGLMLRKQRSELPDQRYQAARIKYFQREMETANSVLYEVENAKSDLRGTLDSLVDAADADQRELLELGEEIAVELRTDLNQYLDELYAAAALRDDTRKFTEEYRDFIDQHVLWIRSSEPLSASDLSISASAFKWLVDYSNWRSMSQLVMQDVGRVPVLYGLAVIGFAVLIINQSRLRRQLAQYSATAAKSSCVDYSATAWALLITLLIAVPVPIVLHFASWRLSAALDAQLSVVEASEFIRAMGHGLFLAAVTMFPMELLRQTCRPDGLGLKHFGWEDRSIELLRKHARWWIDFSVPLVWIIGTLAWQSNASWDASLGRLSFILLMLLLSAFFFWVFSPKSGIAGRFIVSRRDGWLDRLSMFWYPVATIGPLVLALVAWVGYFYTAQRFSVHLNSTLWMIVFNSILYCAIKRWLVINRRRIMLAQARERLQEAAKRESALPTTGKLAISDEVDLTVINEQTQRLLTGLFVACGLAGLYLIWVDVLPAIALLDNVPLWTVSGASPEEDVVISLANLVLVIPILILVIIAARNVPGLLEIALLQHLPLTNAARYAVTTLARYIIVGIGIVVASTALGLRWSSIQWLVAALGVGLGFGLQEIFANFVSGIILLFEQPIRVGDVITIDGTTGSVSKIRMRATTIVNWDRQELVVPNKDLITGKLLNWTLTDTTNRIVVQVGIAYGSDTQQACEIVRELCDKHPNVMRDPGPIVTFEGFGDNTLNLVLRAYLETLDNRLGTVHELHEQIYRAFGEAGIEISFPQRDLHVRSLPEPLARWLGEKPSGSPTPS